MLRDENINENVSQLAGAISRKEVSKVKDFLSEIKPPLKDNEAQFIERALENTPNSEIGILLLENNAVREKCFVKLIETFSDDYNKIAKDTWMKLGMSLKIGKGAEFNEMLSTAKFSNLSSADMKLVYETAAKYGQTDVLKSATQVYNKERNTVIQSEAFVAHINASASTNVLVESTEPARSRRSIS